MHYQVTVKILVEGPAEYSRATEKFVHGTVQNLLVGCADEEIGLEIIGASVEEVRQVAK